ISEQKHHMTCSRHCAIDVHTHMVPSRFPPYSGISQNVPWPSTVPAKPCHCHVMVSGKVYRTVSNQSWDAARRLDDMDSSRIRTQVVSPMPELLSYWLDVRDATQLLRFLNEEIADMAARHP